MSITISEALAEVKTIGKRLEKKRAFVMQSLARQEGLRDPFEKEGGTPKLIATELQAIGDLEIRILELRTSIQRTNERTVVKIGDSSMTVAEWLVWRRDVMPKQKEFFGHLAKGLDGLRTTARQKGLNIVQTVGAQATSPNDIIVHIDEADIIRKMERLETILGELDGRLSVVNATTHVDARLPVTT